MVLHPNIPGEKLNWAAVACKSIAVFEKNGRGKVMLLEEEEVLAI